MIILNIIYFLSVLIMLYVGLAIKSTITFDGMIEMLKLEDEDLYEQAVKVGSKRLETAYWIFSFIPILNSYIAFCVFKYRFSK